MKKEIINEPNWKELLQEHQMTPSPQVWDRIASANPTPVMVPKAGKHWIWWSAATFVVAGFVAVYFIWIAPEQDTLESFELFVPTLSNDHSSHFGVAIDAPDKEVTTSTQSSDNQQSVSA